MLQVITLTQMLQGPGKVGGGYLQSLSNGGLRVDNVSILQHHIPQHGKNSDVGQRQPPIQHKIVPCVDHKESLPLLADFARVGIYQYLLSTQKLPPHGGISYHIRSLLGLQLFNIIDAAIALFIYMGVSRTCHPN